MTPEEISLRRYMSMPHAERGMTVGLFGGSFNPPHEGHALVADLAVKRLGLDQLWWMVTPGNPLKDKRALAPLGERIARSKALASDPRIRITAFEGPAGLSYSADTVAYVQARNPGVRFVWVMGADSLAGFDRWHRWQRIASSLPIAVIDRPGWTMSALSARFARVLARHRIREHDARLLAGMAPPAWVFIHGRRSSQSSTRLREAVGRGQASSIPDDGA